MIRPGSRRGSFLQSSHDSSLTHCIPSFFRNTGAVAAVFAVVGLAVTCIVIFIVVFLHRRRRAQTAAHKADLAKGVHARRSPLDNEDGDVSPPQMDQRATIASIPSMGRSSGATYEPVNTANDPAGPSAFNPYEDFALPGAATPPTAQPVRHSPGNAWNAGGSREPLLAAYYTQLSPPPPPPQNPNRMSERARAVASSSSGHLHDDVAPVTEASSLYSSESNNGRLDPTLKQRLKDSPDTAPDERELRDDVDYSRPVLGVRVFFFLFWSNSYSCTGSKCSRWD